MWHLTFINGYVALWTVYQGFCSVMMHCNIGQGLRGIATMPRMWHINNPTFDVHKISCYFLNNGHEWSKRILVATRLFHLDPHHCFFHFFNFLNCSTIYYFWQFSGPKLPKPFWGPKRLFFGINKYESILDSIFVVYGCIPWIDLSNDVSCASNGGSMPKLRHGEIDVPKLPNGNHILAFHLLGLGF